MKKSILFPAVMLFVLITFSGITQDVKIFQSNKLVKKWETAPVFKVPESVCFAGGNLLYVANINGKPTDKDGNGFISIITTDGGITKGPDITGLNAPKGMGIYNDKLYVSDIDRVAEIDLKNKSNIRFYEFPEAKFLNDIAIGQDGAVYISDMMSTRIYRILNGKTEVWLDNEILTSPNGLFIEGNQLIIGCNKIIKAGIDDKKLTVWLDNTGGIDGLEGTGDGRYIFSDWQGNVYLAGADKKIEKILDTTPAGINAADIEYIPSLKLILVPTFSDNRVMAYELK